MRTCSKLRCESPAQATVVLRYDVREVLIAELVPQRDTNLLELCGKHAEGLTPPRGWRITDQRAREPAPRS